MNIMYSNLSNEVRVIVPEDAVTPLTYRITDPEGRLIRKGQLPANGKTHNISTNGMPEGNYYFTVLQQSLRFEKRKLFG